MNPSIFLKECRVSIANFRVSGSMKEGFHLGRKMHRESCPRFIRFHFSQPQPSHSQSPTKFFKAENAQPSQLNWPAHSTPSHQAVSPSDFFFSTPQKSFPDFINILENSWM
ncbi:UDP-glcnac-adolichol phosphate glcnac-1-p-transferase [Zea mays]|uniref:UDP-glcnac-adolichol phosphate glcnac-1-p-transferase n=1 Tax=Zea mays TaxID=4577 RepID=A0A1D6F3Q9_MAIZE|nr:UDP-glcnac-adolichol phosphate glcnac-1-p-transferase [Zea mays]ONM25980.1 UDP-glcnac-adolichol phosphate glcnac-1-p-transferase [Zea mays]